MVTMALAATTWCNKGEYFSYFFLHGGVGCNHGVNEFHPLTHESVIFKRIPVKVSR